MARTPDQILALEIGKLQMSVAQLMSRVEVLTEENARLTAAIPKPPDPPQA